MSRGFSGKNYLTLLLLVYVAGLFIFLNNWGVIETSEARYAEIAREMLATGDWIHPQLLSIYHYHKPPGTYWITAFAYTLFGITPFAARFFLQVSLLIQIFLIYKIAISIFNEENTALLSAAIYSSMPLVLASARGLTTDTYLTTSVLLTLYTWLQWRQSGKIIWLYVIGLVMGIGFLIKGPLILIIPLLFFLGMSSTQSKRRFSYHHVIAILLFLITGLSWYIYLVNENTAFFSYFLMHQTVERVTNADVFRRHQPFWYYFAYAPLLALPWSIPFITGLFKTNWKNMPVSFRRLIIWSIALPLIFFSIVSSKLVLYVLPVFPIVALCTSYLLVHYLNTIQIERTLFFYFSALSIVLGLAFLAPTHWKPDLIILPVITLGLLIYLKFNNKFGSIYKIIAYAFVFTILLLIYSSRFMGYNELKVNSIKPLSEWINHKFSPSRTVIVYNRLLPSLSFHMNKSIVSLNDGTQSLDREIGFQTTERWKNELLNLNSPLDSLRFRELITHPSILISKGQLPLKTQWIKMYYSRNHEIEGWFVYYNE